jgi:hypothetical protein
MKENANVNRREVFEVGEEVLLVTKDFDLSNIHQDHIGNWDRSILDHIK